MKLIFLLSLLQFIKMESEKDFLDLTQKSKNTTIENCICVPYWQCKEDFSGLIEDGLNIIDIRITKPTNLEPCKGDFDVCCQVECGRRNTNLPLSFQNDTWKSRILGENNEADFGEFPWMLGIIQHNIFLCGGSLIHPKVAVTAAHCILEDETYVVRAGEWNWATKSEPLPFQERKSDKIIVHTKYRPESLENDIALIILTESFQLTENIGVVCLPSSSLIPPKKSNENCLVTGWGKSTKGGTYQSILKKVTLPLIERRNCSKILGNVRLGPHFRLHKSFTCAGGNSKDACKGDGGSPLVCPISGYLNRYEQVGIVSWGLTCGVYKTPGVYVNVGFFIEWIDREMNNNGFNSRMYKKN